ncbi:hypothetical protein TREMEDRAFT_61469 [Tremella mesenterica DSM 1558]|uniref:uncharacterized protein n=1 Tax=Tremella mesenterica (strain ATCC 24925 / CBS 8224 / DSM 1558 / NBRC 9311 / NRRL Y-6157 / RJB 2259-6 / UBC 559-6) TaxID=578456 RepID=UPI0003F492E9|nr:uncharacterized protein TREMEDRAFT_61469 [Tremella mesenterica DSM 1558]EIW70951.1 hypothetical protein TREMEDRAFT_61469 [Tremella mesenterica DSM 1558]
MSTTAIDREAPAALVADTDCFVRNLSSLVDSADEDQFHVDGVSYFSPTEQPIITIDIDNAPSPHQKFALSVIRIPTAGTDNASQLRQLIESHLEVDDVFSVGFMKTVLLVPSSDSSKPYTLDPSITEMLSTIFNTTTLYLHHFISPPASQTPGIVMRSLLIPMQFHSGPYLGQIDSGSLDVFPVFRLYPDAYRTFVVGVYPVTNSTSYKTLRRLDENGDLLIPVPSRLDTKASAQSSLQMAGQRVAVKDIYDLEGVHTTAGNRAFGKIYGTARDTAPVIRKLEDLGAVVVGKVKTAMFATGGSTNDVTVIEQYPFSPRSDLHQSGGASSSGSACAVGAYEWLDAAVGSDTGGSVRLPAALLGLYGNRPSTGALSLDKVTALSSYSDTAGLFSRLPTQFTSNLRAWLHNSPLNFQTYKSLPKKIYYPTDYLPHGSPEARMIVEDFLTRMETVLGMERVPLDFATEAAKVGYDQQGFGDLRKAYLTVSRWWQWNHVGKQFVEKYGELNGGRYPPLDPKSRDAWVLGRTLTLEDYEGAVKQLREFARWFSEGILGKDDESGSRGIFVYDIGTGGLPNYREATLNDGVNAITPLLSPGSIASSAGCPDITLPIGQARFTSVISGKEEMKPVTINLVAPPGTDLMLLDVIDRLAQEGLLREVKTGRTAF